MSDVFIGQVFLKHCNRILKFYIISSTKIILLCFEFPEQVFSLSSFFPESEDDIPFVLILSHHLFQQFVQLSSHTFNGDVDLEHGGNNGVLDVVDYHVIFFAIRLNQHVNTLIILVW